MLKVLRPDRTQTIATTAGALILLVSGWTTHAGWTVRSSSDYVAQCSSLEPVDVLCFGVITMPADDCCVLRHEEALEAVLPGELGLHLEPPVGLAMCSVGAGAAGGLLHILLLTLVFKKRLFKLSLLPRQAMGGAIVGLLAHAVVSLPAGLTGAFFASITTDGARVALYLLAGFFQEPVYHAARKIFDKLDSSGSG